MWGVITRPGGNLTLLWQVRFCSDFEIDSGMWATFRWRTPLRYTAVCGLVLALGAHWASVGPPHPGARTHRMDAEVDTGRVAAAPDAPDRPTAQKNLDGSL
jgi:hypothetical protein